MDKNVKKIIDFAAGKKKPILYSMLERILNYVTFI
jgi:hypothetical protein